MTKDFDYSTLIVPVTAIGITIGLVALVSQVKGFFTESKEDKEFKEEEKKIDFVFTQSFVNYLNKKAAGKKLKRYDKKRMIEYAQRIKNAIGTFSDDESAIHSVFQNLDTQIQALSISLVYDILFKKSLLGDIQNNLGQKDLIKIYTALRKLPLFRLENGTAIY